MAPPPSQKNKKHKNQQQHSPASRSGHLEQLPFFSNTTVFLYLTHQKTCFFTLAKPQDQSKSIGHWILLLVRGLKPKAELLPDPNMKFHFFRIHEINSVLPVARTPICAGHFCWCWSCATHSPPCDQKSALLSESLWTSSPH